MTEYRELTVEDVEAMEESIHDCVDGWFLDGPLGAEEFIDRFCNTYLPSDVDLTSYDSPPARLLLKIARAYKREVTG